MTRKVALSLSPVVDSFLTEQKQKTGISKSQVLTLLVNRHGEELAKDLSKYAKKGGTPDNGMLR